MIPKHTKTYQTYIKTILVYQPTALVSFLRLAAPYQNDVKPGGADGGSDTSGADGGSDITGSGSRVSK